MNCTSYSVLPVLCLDGILCVSIIKGSFDYQSFGEFIDKLLDQMNLFLKPNSVIVMDNCRIHKSEENLEKITQRFMIHLIHGFSSIFNTVIVAADMNFYRPIHQITIQLSLDSLQ